MHDPMCLISIPDGIWQSYPQIRPLSQLAGDALTMERRIAKRTNALVESERLQEHIELIQAHARALLKSLPNSQGEHPCRSRSFGLAEALNYIRLLNELASSPNTFEPPRAKIVEYVEHKEFYKEVTLPPEPIGWLDWIAILFRIDDLPKPRIERRLFRQDVAVSTRVEITPTTGHQFPWQMSFFQSNNDGKNEVEHYYDLLLRIRLDEHLLRLNLSNDETKRLRATVLEVTKFFEQAALDSHSVVITLVR